MPDLSVTIHLSAEDMVEAMRTTPPVTARTISDKTRNRTSIICIAIMSAFIVIVALRVHAQAPELTLQFRLIVASVALVIYWGFSWFIWLNTERWQRFGLSCARRGMVFLVKLVYARRRGILCDHTYVISEQGLTESTEVNHTLNPWADCKTVDISADFIVVRMSHGGAYIIPRRDFPSEAEYLQFAQELRRRLPGGYVYDGFPVTS